MAKANSKSKFWFPIALGLGVLLMLVVIVGQATQYQGFLNPQLLNRSSSEVELGETTIKTIDKQFSAEFFKDEDALVQTMHTHEISGKMPNFELDALDFDINSNWLTRNENIEFWIKTSFPSWIEVPVTIELMNGSKVLKETKAYPEADLLTISMSPDEIGDAEKIKVAFKDLSTDLRFVKLDGSSVKMPKLWLSQVKVGEELSD